MKKEDLTWLKTTVIGLLLAGNGFFIKRLVDKLDANTEVTWQLRQDVVVLQALYNERKKNCIVRGE